MNHFLHRYDAVMISYHEGIGPSATHEVDRRPCATKIGADFCRRFRLRQLPVLSFLAGNYSLITEPGGDEMVKTPDWFERLWGPAYFVRSRWDGLRHGFRPGPSAVNIQSTEELAAYKEGMTLAQALEQRMSELQLSTATQVAEEVRKSN